jgi:hypothetical protein
MLPYVSECYRYCSSSSHYQNLLPHFVTLTNCPSARLLSSAIFVTKVLTSLGNALLHENRQCANLCHSQMNLSTNCLLSQLLSYFVIFLLICVYIIYWTCNISFTIIFVIFVFLSVFALTL